MKEITPEEKLLRLIKEKGKKESKSKSSLLSFKGNFPLFKIINFILISIVGVVFLFFLVDFLLMKNRISEIESVVSKTPPAEQVESIPKQELPSLPEIEELIQKKNIFSADTNIPQFPDAKVQKEQTASHNLNLLGVITGIRPQAIIEDPNLKKTYFLNKGDTFGEYKVMQIKEGRVILEYQGKEIELNL